MATFTQWRAGGSKLARVVYVSAASEVLAEEVVADIRGRFPPAETYYAGEDRDPVIWDALATLPWTPEEGRLTVVRDAQRIRNWEPLPHILGAYRALAHCTVLFVDNRPGKETNPPADTEHGRLLRKSGGAILIKASVPAEGELQTWVESLLPGCPELAGDVVRLTGGDLDQARDLCEKVTALSVRPDRQLVAWLAGEPATDFAQAVIAVKRPAAFAAAASLTADRLGFAIGTLSVWLDDLAILQPALARKASVREIGALGVREYRTIRLRDHAARYSPGTIRRDRGVLLMAVDAWRNGQSAGVGEAIAALW